MINLIDSRIVQMTSLHELCANSQVIICGALRSSDLRILKLKILYFVQIFRGVLIGLLII